MFVWTDVFESLGQTPRSRVAGPLVSLTGRVGSKGGAGSLASEAQWGMTGEAVVTLGPSGQKRVGRNGGCHLREMANVIWALT